MRSTLILIALALALALPYSRALAQPRELAPPDLLMPTNGDVSVSLATGVPFLAIAELSVGIGDSFALGFVAGITPVVEGAGLRLRGLIARHERLSLLFDAPILYYPENRTRAPWFLTRPSLIADYRIDDRIHIQAGFGLIATAPLDNDWPPKLDGVWQTVRAGCVVPFGDRFAFIADAGVVLDGLALAGPEWGGGPPLVVTLGVSYLF